MSTVPGTIQMAGRVVGSISSTQTIKGRAVMPSAVNIERYTKVFYVEGNIDLDTLDVTGITTSYDYIMAAINAGHSIVARLKADTYDELLLPMVKCSASSFEFVETLLIKDEIKTLHGKLYSDMRLIITGIDILVPIATETEPGVVAVGDGLKIDAGTGVLRVNTTKEASQDNTLPMSAAGVYIELGNIKSILESI